MARSCVWVVVAAVGIGCGSSGTSEPTGSGPVEVAPGMAEETEETSETSELQPDPITRPLTEAEARSEARRLAERAFAEARPPDANGRPVESASFPEEEWQVTRREDGWTLSYEPPAGSWARVRLGLFGDHPEVEVGFATE